MKKITSLLLASAMLISSFSACSSTPTESSKEESIKTESSANDDSKVEDSSPKESGELNLFTWEGMFPQEVLDGFQSETGIKVNYSNFDTDETMLSKLQAAKGGDYDLVIADDYIIETAIAQNLVLELDTSKISNIANVNPAYQSQFYDPDNKYTVPHGSGVMTIVYDPSLTDVEIKGYEDLWNSELADSVGLVDNPRVINGVTLLTMGESMNCEDVDKITAAGEKLNELAPNIRLIQDANLQDALLTGEVSAALMYASATTMAMLTNPELEVVFPEEGLGFGIMAQFIPVNAPNAEAAYKFIDYILQPEISKSCFEYLGYYCTNAAADDLIDDAYKSFLTLPESVDTSKMEIVQNISNEAMEAHTKVWTAFKDNTSK